jgi:hypothetical protein
VFAFFSDARDLEEITPSWLGFPIQTPGPIHLATGTRIHCRLGLHGIPLGWTTEIRQWRPPLRFVGAQLNRPYGLWHHTHRFEAKDGGTLMTGIVRYRLPMGIIGWVVHRLKVQRHVERIFDYRFRRKLGVFDGTLTEAE